MRCDPLAGCWGDKGQACILGSHPVDAGKVRGAAPRAGDPPSPGAGAPPTPHPGVTLPRRRRPRPRTRRAPGLCTRPPLRSSRGCAACGQLDRESRKKIWLAVRAAGAAADAAIYTIFTFCRTKSGRLPATLGNSAFARLAGSANPGAAADRVPLLGHRASLF